MREKLSNGKNQFLAQLFLSFFDVDRDEYVKNVQLVTSAHQWDFFHFFFNSHSFEINRKRYRLPLSLFSPPAHLEIFPETTEGFLALAIMRNWFPVDSSSSSSEIVIALCHI